MGRRLNGEIMAGGPRHDKEGMSRQFFIVCGVVLVGLVVGVILWMTRGEGEEVVVEEKRPARRTLKKNRPVLRKSKKRVFRNAIKRRRARKAGSILLDREGHESAVNPGGEQVGFFG
jgi:hypothetical protein